MWQWHGSEWGWVWMTVMMVGFWVLVAIGIAALVRSSGAQHGPTRTRGSSTPEDLLAERFALGEIDVDEYERRRDVLDGRRRT